MKQIIEHLNLSQSDFANELKVTFQTVNRRENGHVYPNKLAQSNIYEYCKNKNVPVYEMILDRIEKETRDIKTDSNRILLYHSSKSGIKGKIKPISRDKCDFGKGFYMGIVPSQPLTLIAGFDSSRFYIVSLDLSDLSYKEVPTGLDWVMLVALNKGKIDTYSNSPVYRKYRNMTLDKDLIIGNIVNDKIFFVMDRFFGGDITDKALVSSLSALELGKQYAAVSQKACDNVRIEKEIELSYLERQIITDAADLNREKGIRLANDICKDHRHEGLYFDEIMEGIVNGRA